MYDKKRFYLSIFWIVLGIVLMALSMAEIMDSSMYSGLGGGLIAVGVLQTIRHLKYNRNPKYREKIDTEISDERNRFLRMKSWSWAGYIAILVEGVGVIVAMLLGQETIQMVLGYSVCLLLCAYWISYMVLSRKY